MYHTSTQWVFVPANRQEHQELITFCKTMSGKSHGLVSVWYTGRGHSQQDGLDHKGIVVKKHDLAMQIILAFAPTEFT